VSDVSDVYILLFETHNAEGRKQIATMTENRPVIVLVEEVLRD